MPEKLASLQVISHFFHHALQYPSLRTYLQRAGIMAAQRAIPSGVPGVPDYFARSYQVEMFEASLKENIVVAMGTGSGKTHIALLRIMHELERSDGKKLIWFLAPTVALCLQQQKLIAKHIPVAKSRTLTGLDKVELWTEQAVWDEVLNEIQVVVSTPAVLLDAMTHGFVRISRLGLIIFDEAHHTVRNHPANRIMQLFYHPAAKKCGHDAVPRILGLTASAASNTRALETVEANLGSVCTTPQTHRHELLEYTHKPELERVLYTPQLIEGGSRWGGTHKALLEAWEMLDPEDDPYVKKLKSRSSNSEALQAVLASGKTYCSTQLKSFVSRVVHILDELGVWAADYFIWASVEQLRSRVHNKSFMLDLDNDEKKYLLDLLSRLPVPNTDAHSTDPADFPVSPKFQALMNYLCKSEQQDFSGLVFVQQRTTVAVMAHLLTVHPLTRDCFRIGSFVGMSNSSKSKEMLGDLLTSRMQRNTLDEFRDGRKNLIVATDVLEEGIDVSACSLVVSYNKPANLKSFVQRRGRARRRDSKYAMVLSTEDNDSHLEKWRALEQVMEEAYRQEQRRLEGLRVLEDISEDVNARFCIESTGALLTAANAMQHLFHFCSHLPRGAHVDPKPEFSFDTRDGGLLRGKVTLPSSVTPSARCAEGTSWWKTERAARKDAAFQAYKALYEHGLVNDNLLPLSQSKEFTLQNFTIAAMQIVQGQYDPWVDWAHLWSSPVLHESRILVRCGGHKAYMKMVTPAELPQLEPMTLFWDKGVQFSLEFETSKPVSLIVENVRNMRAVTGLYLQATTTKQLDKENDFIALFGPDVPHTDLGPWLDKYRGSEPAATVYERNPDGEFVGVVRNRERYGELLLFNKWINNSDGLHIECSPYPKRRNLLKQPYLPERRNPPSSPPGQTIPTKRSLDQEPAEAPSKKQIIPAAYCTIDRLPAAESLFGRFIAIISSRLESTLIVHRLATTLLHDIHFANPSHIETAITTPRAQAASDYQRYEFFGDCVLKFTVATSLFYKNPTWHEGYLTQALAAIVQNSTLARATLTAGLDNFIIDKRFRARKWEAPRISTRLALDPATSENGEKDNRRYFPSKTLADIIESLIGAAYIDGGHDKARTMIRRLLPYFELTLPSPTQPSSTPHLINYEALERRLGYSFKNKSLLLEAFTYPSCHDTEVQSYQRLEFLGDAVLDMIVVEEILAHPAQLKPGEMTKIKQAVVNANLLAFFSLEAEVEGPNTNINNNPSVQTNNDEEQETQNLTPHHLYTHIRHSPATPILQSLSSKTLPLHAHLRHQILDSLTSPAERTYPWLALSTLSAPKFLSDLIESTLGAIFVDSAGDLAPCRAFVESLGLLSYLRRALRDEVDVVHPVQRVQEVLARMASSAAAAAAMAKGAAVKERELKEREGRLDDWGGGIEQAEPEPETQHQHQEQAEEHAQVEAAPAPAPWKFEIRTERVTPKRTRGRRGITQTGIQPETQVPVSHKEELVMVDVDNVNDNPSDNTALMNPQAQSQETEETREGEEEGDDENGEATYTTTIPLSLVPLPQSSVLRLHDVVITGARSRDGAEVKAAVKALEVLEEWRIRQNGINAEGDATASTAGSISSVTKPVPEEILQTAGDGDVHMIDQDQDQDSELEEEERGYTRAEA
ncbi:hypothetical protein BJY04DRAFT_221780 [Aspergillus karnatakaensis]|uniref:putative RNA helicase/RNAse III n=1 Tax=Aspergillus karnatakaensis TaxID=1810916 RepID=UPI003CCCBE8D